VSVELTGEVTDGGSRAEDADASPTGIGFGTVLEYAVSQEWSEMTEPLSTYLNETRD
jgi:hypothetical protein